jgi:hypothetical protein
MAKQHNQQHLPSGYLAYSEMTEDQKRLLIGVIRQMLVDFRDGQSSIRRQRIMIDMFLPEPRARQTRSGLFLEMSSTLPFQLWTPWGSVRFPHIFDGYAMYVQDFLDRFSLAPQPYNHGPSAFTHPVIPVLGYRRMPLPEPVPTASPEDNNGLLVDLYREWRQLYGQAGLVQDDG